MEERSIQKFYPTPEELSSVCTQVVCPEDNCKASFRSTSNLNMHLIKHHKKMQGGLAAKKSESQYFCPKFSCPYYKDSMKHFTKMKYLKQHFLKVHASKEFVCKKCEKKFSTEAFRTLHMKTCGEIYNCKCGARYTSSEAIVTHVKRKGSGHELLKTVGKEITTVSSSNKTSECNTKKERLIYPKITGDITFPIHYIAAVALSELSVPQNLPKVVNKGIQTETMDFDFSKDQTVKCEKKRKYSQQTQTMTGRNRKPKISTQTQTNTEYLKRKGKTQLKTPCRKRKKSMETQTNKFLTVCESEETSLNNFSVSVPNSLARKNENEGNEKINFIENNKLKNEVVNEDEENARKWLWEMVSSSNGKNSELDLLQYTSDSPKNSQVQYESKEDSQGNQEFDLSKLCNIETQTDIDSFLIECNDDTTFTLCSTTETQTTDDFDSLLYSNMCTQTCEDVDQLFDFNFVHNETQTAWPDLNDC